MTANKPAAFCEDTALSIAERTFSTEVDEQLASDIIQYAQRLHSLYAAPKREEQKEPDSLCVEDDGCPTEKAVLQRFWRKHHQTAPDELSDYDRGFRDGKLDRLIDEVVAESKLAEPVGIEFPEYHSMGMGCGLEDRGITDRYEAMRYGWEEALDRMAEELDNIGPLYLHPQPAEQQPEPVWRNLRAVHAMILSALDRDAADGKAVRGEMAAELRSALSEQQPSAGDSLTSVPDEAFAVEFAAWWEEHGQFCRAGGGTYEKSFAFEAWRHLYPQLMKLQVAAEEQQPIIPSERGKNRYGLDMSYFRNLFNRELNQPLVNFKPSELARVLARASRTADPKVMHETEFQIAEQKSAPDVNWLASIARDIVELHDRRGVVLTVHVEALKEALATHRKGSDV